MTGGPERTKRTRFTPYSTDPQVNQVACQIQVTRQVSKVEL